LVQPMERSISLWIGQTACSGNISLQHDSSPINTPFI